MKDKTMKLDLQMFATASTQNQNTTCLLYTSPSPRDCS